MADWVIVVDDDVTNLKMAGHILSKQNMRVTALKSGLALIEYVKTNQPDLILLDVMMPGLDGFETMERLKGQMAPGREIPIIFLTADENRESEMRGLRLGAMDFIRKPFVPRACPSAAKPGEGEQADQCGARAGLPHPAVHAAECISAGAAPARN